MTVVWTSNTATVTIDTLTPPPPPLVLCEGPNCSPNADLAFDMEDMDFILKQIKFAERHAAGENLLDILPNASIPWGLRTVDGTFNNLIPGQEHFGAADLPFPQLTIRDFPDAQAGTSYNSATDVVDSNPRLLSHLTTNQSVDNPAAVATAAAEGGENIGPDITGRDQFFIPNTGPDAALSAPINAFMTFFGQFFDHGLDLINKGGNGVVMIPLQAHDPLFDPGPDLDPLTLGDNGPNMMILPRATRGAGPDNMLGNEDDTFLNATTPHVDQQQTYGSEASSQILLRHYELRPCALPTGCLQNTGRMLNGFGVDRLLDTADDGGMATWDTAQAQASEKLGLDLDDQDGDNVPMILSDPYGKFIPGPNGLPQLVAAIDINGIPTLVEGNLANPVDASPALRTHHSFFLDVAHSAAPHGLPDTDSVINPRTDMLSGQVTRGIRASAPAGFYDDELLGAHFICGDGRCNENIALSTIHTVFHHEHNRLTSIAKRVLLDAGDLAKLNEWLDTPLAAFPAWGGLPFLISDASLGNQATTRDTIDALGLDWNGERIFQAARFGTEMQYNRIVFDEFSPTLAGLKDVFEGFHTDVDPSITAEFSQSVYRFGHSMLTQSVDRYDRNFNPIVETHTGDPSQLGLFEAFLNPLALYNSDDAGVPMLDPLRATGAVIRGITRTVANEIDEFVTGALQNNLVGLPLDLGAINIARGHDVGNPPLNAARRMFFAETQDTRLRPYLHWADYADNLRHELSLVNFIAAYGTHPSLAGTDGIIGSGPTGIGEEPTTFAARRAAACAIVGTLTADATAYCTDNGFAGGVGKPPVATTPADAIDFLFSTNAWVSGPDGLTTTGLDDVDFWNGGLAEARMPFGGYLGSTHNYVFETQMESLQNGDRFYYVGRTGTIHLLGELESNSFTSLIMRSTDLGEVGGDALSLNIFLTQDLILQVDQSQQFNAAGDGTTADPTADSVLLPLVIRDATQARTNIHIADATRFVQLTGPIHATIGGTAGDDTILGGIDDDTILGGAGNDRIDGGDGPDLIEGGPGDDIITDLSGADVIQGGAGNDAINSGNEEDVIFGDDGHDFIVNPSEFGEIFAGLGDDYIFDGIHLGHIRGGAGDDWMENLGGGEDLFQGDNGAAPEGGEPPIKGNDVFIAHGGNNDADMENGDDIVVSGPGIDRAEGQLGFDWMSFQNDTFGVNIDLDLDVFLRPQLPPSNATVQDRYDRIEGLSGSPLADILKGTGNPLGTNGGNELSAFGFTLIDGLSALVPMGEHFPLGSDLLTGEDLGIGWTGGEIIIGGAGSDLMVGEGGDDIIDGDASLQVGILTPDPAIRAGALGQALRAAKAAHSTAVSRAALDDAAVIAATELQTAAAAVKAAADAAVVAANDAVTAANAAQAGLSALSITDAIGNLIVASGPAAVQAAWTDFLTACSAALGDLGIDVNATADSTLAEALAAQAAAMVAQAEVQMPALLTNQTMSAAAVAPLAAAKAAAQTALDAADVLIVVDGMADIMDAVFEGYINPGELSISRVIADRDPTDADTDTAVFSGNQADYTVFDRGDGFVQVTDNRPLPPNLNAKLANKPGNEGKDLLRNVERLAFADGVIAAPGAAAIGNSVAVGQPTITGSTMVGGTLTASIAGVTDADNVSTAGAIANPVDWIWQSEQTFGSDHFSPIFQVNAAGDNVEIHGENLVVSAAEVGLRVRVVGIFQDEAQVVEIVTSAPVLVP